MANIPSSVSRTYQGIRDTYLIGYGAVACGKVVRLCQFEPRTFQMTACH